MDGAYRLHSCLWKKSLGEESNWGYDDLRIILVSALEALRKNAGYLAAEISKDLPEYTVHDKTHLDSLWEIASIIAGDKVVLNPIEGFVFGASVLLHDLGNAVAAYVDGVDNLKQQPNWNDIFELEQRKYLSEVTSAEERIERNKNIEEKVIEYILRQLHAEQAETLVRMEWEHDGSHYKLIENQELQEHFGEIIGRIAASHGWSLEKVAHELRDPLAPSPTFPPEWELDVLKVACLLRVADAGHIDSRRAPSLLSAIKKIEGNLHWNLQNHLARPILQNGWLVYKSIRKFDTKDINAWWLGYEFLRMIDKELHDVYILFKELNRNCFAAQGVKGIESPARLSDYLRINGWYPIDAHIKVSDLPRLVKNLGGEELYGKSPVTPLRELIQNASDAICARRKLENKENWGKITVRLGVDNGKKYWIEVADNGVGMSKRIMTENLLDFGTSLWESEMIISEHPNLLSSGFKHIGKFGIGFFSVFMWSHYISVTSRSIYKGPSETNELVFASGVNERPILLEADRNNQMLDAGTKVKVYISDLKIIDNMVKEVSRDDDHEYIENLTEKLAYICRKVAPCLEVDVSCKVLNEPEKLVYRANSWKTMDGTEFLLHISGYGTNAPQKIIDAAREHGRLVKNITDSADCIIARACVITDEKYQYSNCDGVLTCGGIHVCDISRVWGVFCGEVASSNRRFGKPFAEGELVANWATEQAEMITQLGYHAERLNKVAETICSLGGDTGSLPICRTSRGWESYSQLSNREWPCEVGLVSYPPDNIELNKNIIEVSRGYFGILQSRDYSIWPFLNEMEYKIHNLEYVIIDVFAKAWGTTVENVKKFNKDNRYVNKVIGKSPEGIEMQSRVNFYYKP